MFLSHLHKWAVLCKELKTSEWLNRVKSKVFLAHLTSPSMTEDRCTEKRVQENLSVLEDCTSLQSLEGFSESTESVVIKLS